jgi:hypothetical protein
VTLACRASSQTSCHTTSSRKNWTAGVWSSATECGRRLLSISTFVRARRGPCKLTVSLRSQPGWGLQTLCIHNQVDCEAQECMSHA